jgi:hypothetical protein
MKTKVEMTSDWEHGMYRKWDTWYIDWYVMGDRIYVMVVLDLESRIIPVKQEYLTVITD